MELVPLLAGAAVAALILPAGLLALADNGVTRPNWRGRELPFPAGALAVAAALLALGPLAALQELAGWDVLRPAPFRFEILEREEANVLGTLHLFSQSEPAPEPTALFAMPLALGVAFLGLLDDVLGGAPRGWRGHAGALLRGALSTGVIKAAGTLALALLTFADHGLDAGEYLLAVAVVTLATNVFNLLDLRPGRSIKAFVLLGAGLLAGTQDADPLRAVGLFAGPLLVLGVYDLRERAMLGDTGSNLLGALAGLWLVLALDTTGQLVALALLIALTAYGELRSISTAIDRVKPLRALDRLGAPE